MSWTYDQTYSSTEIYTVKPQNLKVYSVDNKASGDNQTAIQNCFKSTKK